MRAHTHTHTQTFTSAACLHLILTKSNKIKTYNMYVSNGAICVHWVCVAAHCLVFPFIIILLTHTFSSVYNFKYRTIVRTMTNLIKQIVYVRTYNLKHYTDFKTFRQFLFFSLLQILFAFLVRYTAVVVSHKLGFFCGRWRRSRRFEN